MQSKSHLKAQPRVCSSLPPLLAWTWNRKSSRALSVWLGAVLLSALALPFAPMSKAQSWPNGYSFRRTITIDHTKVPNTDQTNFPVLISGTYSFLATTANGGNVTSSSGYDIIFTSDANGATPLAFEPEIYNPQTGSVVYWVKLPALSHTADTVFYLFYGNSSVTTDQTETSLGTLRL